MIAQDQGHIVTIASLAGLSGCNRLVDYCASKFAAVGFDESLRTELAVNDHLYYTHVVNPVIDIYFCTGRWAQRSKNDGSVSIFCQDTTFRWHPIQVQIVHGKNVFKSV